MSDDDVKVRLAQVAVQTEVSGDIMEVLVEVPVEAKHAIVEAPQKVVEKIVEVTVEKIVERIVEVPVEKITEKTVEVPVETAWWEANLMEKDAEIQELRKKNDQQLMQLDAVERELSLEQAMCAHLRHRAEQTAPPKTIS